MLPWHGSCGMAVVVAAMAWWPQCGGHGCGMVAAAMVWWMWHGCGHCGMVVVVAAWLWLLWHGCGHCSMVAAAWLLWPWSGGVHGHSMAVVVAAVVWLQLHIFVIIEACFSCHFPFLVFDVSVWLLLLPSHCFPPGLAFFPMLLLLFLLFLMSWNPCFCCCRGVVFVLPACCYCHVIGIVVVDAAYFVFLVAVVSALFLLLLWHCYHDNNIFEYDDTF